MDQDTQDICGSNYMQDIIRQSLWFPNEVVCLINNSFLPFAQLLIQIIGKQALSLPSQIMPILFSRSGWQVLSGDIVTLLRANSYPDTFIKTGLLEGHTLTVCPYQDSCAEPFASLLQICNSSFYISLPSPIYNMLS